MDVLTSALFEPSVFIALLYAALIIAIIYTDVTCFEIDILGVCAAALCVASLLLGADINIISNIAGAGLMFILAFVAHRIYPKGFGLGDYYLYALMGFCSGLGYLLLLVCLNIAIGLITSATYSVARKKPLFRSSFPAAIPGMIAASLCLLLQVLTSYDVQMFTYGFGFGAIESQLPNIIISLTAQSLIAFLAIIASTLVLVHRALGEERIAW